MDQQTIQACHAAFESGRFGEEQYALVLCQTDSEESLLAAAHQLEELGIRHHLYRDGDFDNEATALATEPLGEAQRKSLNQWKLWRANAII